MMTGYGMGFGFLCMILVGVFLPVLMQAMFTTTALGLNQSHLFRGARPWRNGCIQMQRPIRSWFTRQDR